MRRTDELEAAVNISSGCSAPGGKSADIHEMSSLMCMCQSTA